MSKPTDDLSQGQDQPDFENLSRTTHMLTTSMLERLLPDDAPRELVAAVVAGIAGALMCELWERNGLPPTARAEELKSLWSTLAVDFTALLAAQFDA